MCLETNVSIERAVKMSRITRNEFGKLKQMIAELIEKEGSPPPMDEIAEKLKCSKTTAWRIVKSLGWVTIKQSGHRWKHTSQPDKSLAGLKPKPT